MSGERQLVFGFAGQPPDLRRERFLVSDSNRAAFEAVANDRLNAARMLLVGPAGSGKSHLATIWADVADARIAAASDLTDAEVERMSRGGAWVIEAADRCAGNDEAEARLFHALNLSAAHGTRLLLTARCTPSRWGIGTPDLLSRMNAMPSLTLGPPDDALLSSILAKLFTDKQLSVAPDVTKFLVARMERSFTSAVRVVEELDARALRQGRDVNRKLASELLSSDPALVTGEGEA